MVEAVLRGEPGVRRDVTVLNAAAAFLVAGRVESLEEGVDRAALTIDAGLALELLEALRAERHRRRRRGGRGGAASSAP